MDSASRPLTDVLVVDDSALIRQMMTHILSEDLGFSVRTASDPLIAIRKMDLRRPDVIVLDLQMPRMDGLTFLRHIMSEDPIPVVVCSGLVAGGSEMSMRALQLGATGVVLKPQTGPGESLARWKETLIEQVAAAAHANVRPFFVARSYVALRPIGAIDPAERAVVIGASTGGTEAIAEILAAIPADAPATVIVQHMPSPFTAAFAQRLDVSCVVRVREAVHGDVLRQGTVLIAPGSHHVSLVRQRGGQIAVELGDGPPVNRHRPSVDVLFASAARVLGRSAIGVLLTGMGNDGAKGLLELRQSGAVTIAQDEATSIVFGMPRSAIEAGAAVHVLPLQRIAETIVAESRRGRRIDAVTRRDARRTYNG